MKPTTPEVRPLIADLHKNRGSCCLHIVLEDANVDDGHVLFCVHAATKAGHDDCLRIALLLQQMSKTQRRKLANHGG